MRIIACVKTFNGEDYITEAVASIYNHVDEIVIADCCFGAMEQIVHPSRISPGGLSCASARATLDSISDPDNKITRWDIGLLGGDQTIIYNKFVEYADVGDALWLVDDDEVYPEELAQKLETWVREGTYHAIWLPSIIFWHDFYHIRPDHGKLSHQRIFVKLHESAYYDVRNVAVQWYDDIRDHFGYGLPPKQTLFENKCYQVFVGREQMKSYFHYAYVRSVQRMLEKSVSQYLQNVEPLKGDEYNHCQQYRDPVEFKIETHSWFTNHDYEKVERVDVEHPFSNHKWSRQHWDEERILIDYRQARLLLGWEPPVNVNTRNI